MAHKVSDYQSMLRWISREHDFLCDPGSISGVIDDATIAALGDFRNNYNLDPRFDQDIPLDGPICELDFAAFYDFYDLSLARLLKMEVGDLAQERSALAFIDPPVLGCGEAFNVEQLGDGQRSAVNRRVEILFFKGGQEPKRDTEPPGEEVYGGLVYQRIPITIRSPLHLHLRGADGKAVAGAKYVVSWPDGREISGTLDGSGTAVLEGAPGGECDVRFPDSDWVVASF